LGGNTFLWGQDFYFCVYNNFFWGQQNLEGLCPPMATGLSPTTRACCCHGRRTDILQGANSDETSFYQLATKRNTFFTKTLIGKYQKIQGVPGP